MPLTPASAPVRGSRETSGGAAEPGLHFAEAALGFVGAVSGDWRRMREPAFLPRRARVTRCPRIGAEATDAAARAGTVGA
jgi:hypothetical protein